MYIKEKHKIFFSAYLDIRAGGPSGYLANLQLGLNSLPDQSFIEILPQGPKLAANIAARPTYKDLQQHIASYSTPENLLLTPDELDALVDDETRSVHAHFSADALKIAQSFSANNIQKIPLALTSHCPESVAVEAANAWRTRGYDEKLCNDYERVLRIIEQKAFSAADIWIFPSEEAMQPYRETIPDFDAWATGKDIRYLPTGAAPILSTMSKGAAKAALGVSGKVVISYMGRHEGVKGYDLFCDACLPILENHPHVSVLVAGRVDGLAPPQHPRWIELGWTSNPGKFLQATDIFVLPNRRTYFDLALIEALSAGKAVVASATGGNISVHRMTDGAISLYYGDSTSLRHQITELLDHPETINNLGQKAKIAYEENFTLSKFAQSYSDLIRLIWKDYAN